MSRQEQWNLLDKFRRKVYFKKELKLRLLKSLKKNTSLTTSRNLLLNLQLSSGRNMNFFTQRNNRCLISGRKHTILKKTSTSRFVFRVSAYQSFLPSVQRYTR